MNQPKTIIVGGGVLGCAVSYYLAGQGVKVLLIDKDLPGRATSASAGGLWPVGEAVGLGCGVIYHAQAQSTADSAIAADSPPMLPEEFREFLVRSNSLFPELHETLRSVSGVDIEYSPGAGLMFLAFQESERDFVEGVRQLLPDDGQLEWLSPAQAREMEPSLNPKIFGAGLLREEHQVSPLQLAEAFKRAAIKLGAVFRHDTKVKELVRKQDRIVGVQLEGEFLPADCVVNAAGAWAGNLAATAGLELPVFPVRGQVVLTQSIPPLLNACLSTSSCYLLQKAHGEILIGSTTEQAGFDVGVTHEAITRLCRGAVRAVPELARVPLKRIWAGLRPGTPDELPILGPHGGVSGYFNATGGFRTGIVASPLSGRLVAESILGHPLSFPIETFSADRFHKRPSRVT